MTGPGWVELRELLVLRYEELKTRLSHRLGSDDRAREALHDTYIHLGTQDADPAIRSPVAYLLRIAFHRAIDQGRTERRRAARTNKADVSELIDIADHHADHAREIEMRMMMEKLEIALAEMPERRRNILLAARIDELPQAEIARRFGISTRMVQHELKAALEFCVDYFAE